jgi:hypothetical protein
MQLPDIDQELLIIIAVVAAVVVVGLILLAVLRSRRRRRETERLRSRFGSEYDQAVASEGSRGAVEDLHSREEARESFSPVDPGDEIRDDLRRRMAELQFRFVDDPPDVMLELQRVALDALRACGYPVAEDRERALKLVSVDHPDATQPLRTLLEGAYGRDVAGMQQLFHGVKGALRDVVRVTYSTADLQAGSAHGAATPAGQAHGPGDADERPDSHADRARTDPAGHDRAPAARDRGRPADAPAAGARPADADEATATRPDGAGGGTTGSSGPATVPTPPPEGARGA